MDNTSSTAPVTVKRVPKTTELLQVLFQGMLNHEIDMQLKEKIQDKISKLLDQI